MEYRKLGNTDIDVSVICLGTMTFGNQNTEAEAHEQLDYAVNNGVNFIDTAELYAVPSTPKVQGKTEEYIGTWLNGRTDRDKIVLATKITGPSPNLTFIRKTLKFNKEQINLALNNSLKRLQTDYIDLYQLHWPERKTNFFGKLGYNHDPNDAWEDNILSVLAILNDLVKEGKIRHFGLSNETPWGLSRFLHVAETNNLPRCVSVQNPYSLLNRTYEVGMTEMSIREQAGLLAYSPMAFGILSGKYHKKDADLEKARLTLFPRMARYSGEQSYNATAKYLAIAEKYGLSLAQMSLAYVNSRPFLTSNIIGATTMEQLKENIGSADVNLSNEILEEIEEVHRLIPNPAP